MSEQTVDLVKELGDIREAAIAYERQVEKGNALKRLENNPDFKALILDDYMRDEVIRNLTISHDAALNKDERKDAEDAAHGGVLLRRYLMAQAGMAQAAQNYVDSAAEEIKEIEAEIDQLNNDEGK